MSRDFVPYPWTLSCAWCAFYIVVNPRGMSGKDMGSGVEAAEMMTEHVAGHGHTWREFLEATDPVPSRTYDETSDRADQPAPAGV